MTVGPSGGAPDSDGSHITVGLVTDAGFPAKAGAKAATELPSMLADKLCGDVAWSVETTCEPLLLDADGTIPVFAIADEYRARHGWDLVVLITDLPRRVGAQPIVGDFSTAHHVALASLPALGGGLGLHGRLRALLVHLIGHLTEDRLGISPHARGHTRYGRQAGQLGDLLAPTRHIGSAYRKPMPISR